MKHAVIEVFGAGSGHRRERCYGERSKMGVQQHFRLRYTQISRAFLKSIPTEKSTEKYYYFFKGVNPGGRKMKEVLSKAGRTAKWAIVGVIKGAGNTAESIVTATKDVLLTTVDGVAQVVVATEKAAGQIVAGAVEAASEAGEDIGIAVKSAAKGVVKGASEVGADVGKTAVAAVEGAAKAAGDIGADTAKAIENATTGAIEAAEEIGTDAVESVRSMLKTAVKGKKE